MVGSNSLNHAKFSIFWTSILPAELSLTTLQLTLQVEGAEFYKPHFKNSGFPVRNTCQPRSYFTDVSYMAPDHPGYIL